MSIEAVSPCPEERIAAEGLCDWPIWMSDVSSFP